MNIDIELLWQITVNCWIIFFLVGGWVFTLPLRIIFGFVFTTDQYYWIGIICVPLASIGFAILWTIFEKIFKKPHPVEEILPVINNAINKELEMRKNG